MHAETEGQVRRPGAGHVEVPGVVPVRGVPVRLGQRHHHRTAGSLIEALDARPPGEPVFDALRAAAVSVVDADPYRDRSRVEQMRLLRRSPSLLPPQLAAYAEHERALTRSVAERAGAGEADLYPAVVAAATMAALRVAISRWLTEGEDLVVLVEGTFAQLGGGLAGPVEI